MDSHYPPEYTRGWVEFFYQKFQVNEHVLIPRFETEDLVREAIKIARDIVFDTLIDVGTGSGIIPLSILSVVDIPQVFAVDLSSEALKVAEGNNRNQGKEITFLESDLLGVFLNESVETRLIVSLQNKNILIVTNLPYIRNGDWDNMSKDTRYEPGIALFGGTETGFELYEKLFIQIPVFFEKHQPGELLILAEMGEDQEETATRTLESLALIVAGNKRKLDFSFFADCFGIRRFMKIEII
ncbi:MAG: peptide chain release factor N(5)-glutamine methyltransferase [Candidatus Gracilibacteria bacterium]|nr:peptide chain release factor N(5)-glutamine methyltransferase [Candidatus Gracilibacteria bacterium]